MTIIPFEYMYTAQNQNGNGIFQFPCGSNLLNVFLDSTSKDINGSPGMTYQLICTFIYVLLVVLDPLGSLCSESNCLHKAMDLATSYANVFYIALKTCFKL